MKRSSILLLAGLVVAGCAGGVTPSGTPPASVDASTSVPTAAASPSPASTPAPTVLTSAPSYAPGSTEPPDLQRRAEDAANGIRLTIEAEDVPLEAGKSMVLTVRVENRGTRTVNWVSDGCAVPGLAYVHLNGPGWIGGRPQTGIAATFKTFALEPFGHAGHTPLAIGLPADWPPDGAGCADVGIGHELEPGARLERAAYWRGSYDEAIPEGPAHIVAAFDFYTNADIEPESKTMLEARIPTWIRSDEVVDYIPPGPAIDLALADQEFMTWLAAADTNGWINSSRTLDLEKGTWEIGLFRDGGPGFYASVTLDARTGEVLRHRFE